MSSNPLALHQAEYLKLITIVLSPVPTMVKPDNQLDRLVLALKRSSDGVHLASPN
jgi:hypothetical protein